MVAWPRDVEPLAPSVLITDDNESWRAAVEECLARAGFRTLLARCGEEAIEVVHTERLDVVLIDFHMPRLDGLETLRILRREENWTPAVLMTGRPADLPPGEVQALRVRSVLVKPADREIIVTTVTRVLAAPEA